MASKAPPPSAPAGVPSGGSGKYVVLALLLLGAIGGIAFWKMSQKPPEPTVIYVDAGPPPPVTKGRNPDDDVPLPPPVEDAGSDAGKKVTTAGTGGGPCDVKQCSGANSSELEQALAFRTKQARRCYNNALAQDSTLKGKITLSVKIASTGQVCSANVASNEMGSQTVAQCVAGYFRGANFPAPKGGCVEANIPINFVPGQ